MDGIFSENQERLTDSKVLNVKKSSKLLKKFLSSLIETFSSNENFQENLKSQYTSLILKELTLFMQFGSLLWRNKMIYTSWSKFLWFWKIFGYFRIDSAFKDSNQETVLYYMFSALMYSAVLIFSYLFFCIWTKKTSFSFLRWVLRKFVVFQSSVLFFPVSVVFIQGTLAGFGGFQGKKSESQSSYSMLHVLNSIFCLAFHLACAVFTQFVCCDVNHGKKNKNISSKSCCNLDLKGLAIDFLLISLYCVLPDDRVEIIHGFGIISKFWLSAQYLIFLPYFNKLTNQIVFYRVASELILSVLFVSDYFIQNSQFLVTSSILIIPIYGFLTFHLVNFRYSKILLHKKSLNVYLFELSIREKLMKIEEPCIKIINKFNKLLKKEAILKGNFGSLSLWQSYYCVNALKDYRLAYIKLSQTNKTSFSFEAFIQETKLRIYLKKNFLHDLEDLIFLEYILKLNQTKIFDEEICQIYIEFCTEITCKAPSKGKLKKLALVLDRNLNRVEKSYRKLCLKYPDGVESAKLFQSFLEDIRLNQDGERVKKANALVNEVRELNYFDDTNGILIVSGEVEDLGKIIYTNPYFAMMMRTTSSSLIGSDLNSLIPYPYTIGHNNTLIRYVRTCSTSQLRFPGSLFMRTEKGHLVEFNFKISCISSNHCIFYLVVAREIENNQSCVLLSSEGFIYSTSENFSKLLKTKEETFENTQIQELVPGLHLKSLPLNQAVKINLEEGPCYVIRSIRIIANVEMNLLYFVSTSKALEEVMKQTSKEQKVIIKTDHSFRHHSKIEVEEKARVKFESLNIKESSVSEIGIQDETKIEKQGLTENLKSKPKHEKVKEVKLRTLELMLTRSLSCIQKIKVIFMLFIFFMLVGSSVVLVFYKKQTEFYKNEQLTQRFLGYMDTLQKVSILTGYIQIGVLVNENIEKLEYILQDTKNLGQDLSSSFKDYEACSSLPSSFTENSVVFFEIDSDLYENRYNLFDTIKRFRYYLSLFITNKNLGNSVFNESSVLIINGAEILYHQAEKDLNQIKSCRNCIIKDFTKIESDIIISQICLLITFIIIEVFLISSFIKSSNLFWNRISENAYNSFFEIRSRCCERLTNHLQVREDEVQFYFEMIRTSKNKFKVTLGQIFGYSWRYLLVVILTLTYFTVFYYFLILDLNNSVFQKYELLDSVYSRMFQVQRIESFSLGDFLKEDKKKIFQECEEKFSDTKKKALFRDFGGILNEKIENDFYGDLEVKNFLKFGWHSAGNLVFLESLEKKDDLLAFRNKTSEYYLKCAEIAEKVLDSSSSKITNNESSAILTMISFGCSWIFLYLVFYAPYIEKKGNTIKSFLNIFKLFILVEK